MPIRVVSQKVYYIHRFDEFVKVAPQVLSISYLEKPPKFRVVFQDGFDRLDYIPNYIITHRELEKPSLADKSNLHMGFYKWSWADSNLNTYVNNRFLYFDNI